MQDEIQEIPSVIIEAPDYDPGNPDHVARWELAGKPALDVPDSDGKFWRPTITTVLQPDGSYLPIPAPAVPELSPMEQLFAQVQAKLDRDEFARTGRPVDPRGSVSRARAYAATAMLLGGWHYPTQADLVAGDNPAILAAIYADPSTNTTAESSTAQKQKALHFTLVMLEGQAFGLAYQAELGAYERTASPAFRVAIATDSRDWLDLPCGPWASVRAMFLAVMA